MVGCNEISLDVAVVVIVVAIAVRNCRSLHDNSCNGSGFSLNFILLLPHRRVDETKENKNNNNKKAKRKKIIYLNNNCNKDMKIILNCARTSEE